MEQTLQTEATTETSRESLMGHIKRLLFLITGLAFFLRIINISDFNIYPDSYLYLLTAKNFLRHISPSYLGPNGMFYDPPLNWVTRYGYSFLIAVSNTIFRDLEFSAHIISFLAGLASVPLIYLFCTKLFDSKENGIVGAFLLSLSFTHIAWSGFIMSDTLAVSLILISGIFVVSSVKRQSADFSNFYYDISAGIFAALAVVTRLEYLFLGLPLLFLYTTRSKHFTGKIITFLSGFLGILFIVGIATASLSEIISDGIEALRIHGGLILISFLAAALLMGLFRQQIDKAQTILLVGRKIATIFLVAFLSYIYFQIIIGFLGKSMPYWSQGLTSVRIFAQYEFLIVIAGVLGIAYLLLDSEYDDIGIFALLYIIPLAILYNRVNPLSYRYAIHHLPALVVGASFLIMKLTKSIKEKLKKIPYGFRKLTNYSILTLIVLFLLLQISISAASMKGWRTKTSYEKKAAFETKKIIQDRRISPDAILVTFFAESYYFYTDQSTWRVINRYPYVYDDFPINKPLLIVIDEGVRDQTPEFAAFAERYFASFEIGRFRVGFPYYFKTYHRNEQKPIVVYYLPAGKAQRYLKLAKDIREG